MFEFGQNGIVSVHLHIDIDNPIACCWKSSFHFLATKNYRLTSTFLAIAPLVGRKLPGGGGGNS